MINSVLVKFVTVPAPPSDLRVLPGFQKSGSNAGNCNRTSNSLVRAVQTILWLQEKVDIKNLFFLWSETALSCASVWFWNCASASQIFGSSPAFRKAAATPPTTHVHQIIRSDQYKRLKVYSSSSRIWLEKNIHYNKNNRKAIKSIIFDVWFFLTPSKYYSKAMGFSNIALAVCLHSQNWILQWTYLWLNVMKRVCGDPWVVAVL